MTPLRITAHVPGPMACPFGRIPLDSLLMAQRAIELGLPPLQGEPTEPIAIPIALEPGGRFHLCSDAVVDFEERDSPPRYIHKRAPLEQYAAHQLRGAVNLTSQEDKGWRLPLELGYARGELLGWWCVGDAAELTALLAGVLYLGKKRSNGFGEVRAWTVDPCEQWDGFPVVRDGAPLRRLPLDWTGLDRPRQQVTCLTPPYWAHARAELCAVP